MIQGLAKYIWCHQISLLVLALFFFASSPGFASEYLSSVNSGNSTNNKLQTRSSDQIDSDNGLNTDTQSKKPKKPITVYEDDTEEDEVEEGIAKIYLTIAVPHTKKVKAKVKAYPYPPKPIQSTSSGDLPEKEKEIKALLVSNGYINRTSSDTSFPPGGWRLQYALSKAKKTSKLSVPHSIVEHYQWASKMIRFIKPEIIKINEYEQARRAKYTKYVEFYNDHKGRLRSESLRKNRDIVRFIPLPRDRKKIGRNFGGVLKPGKWWIFAEHKTRGLQYYWIHEIDLNDKDQIVLVFNEGNASLVNGLW